MVTWKKVNTVYSVLSQHFLMHMSSVRTMDTGIAYLLVTLCLTTGVGGSLNSCLANGLIKEGKYLQHSDFAEERHTSIFSCAVECYKYGFCESFNFNTKTKSCSLNFEDDILRPENLIAAEDSVYSSIAGWQLVTASGPCINQTCGKHEKCVVTRVSSTVCDTSTFYGSTYTTEFIISTSKLNWADSAAECQRQHGTLAFIDTPKKRQDVETLIRGKGLTEYVWLGASDVETENTWVWLDGRQLDFTAWATYIPQPNNYRNQDCLAVIYNDTIRYLDWFDNDCSQKQYFLCEFIRKL
ncbi:brevican core protein-like isoform X2 [Haliotis rubra]|uniref:brevican core protein-like isoform X2 n=1 Tax=Haliotis rubra TaxID=36100 RepID=UPI001EE5350D|nr:brevican core protein-like isoform X2 [Haliotis rubra]